MPWPGLLVPRLAVEGPFGVAAPLGGFGVLRSGGWFAIPAVSFLSRGGWFCVRTCPSGPHDQDEPSARASRRLLTRKRPPLGGAACCSRAPQAGTEGAVQARIAWLSCRCLEGELYSQVSSICPYLWLDPTAR